LHPKDTIDLKLNYMTFVMFLDYLQVWGFFGFNLIKDKANIGKSIFSHFS